MKSKLPKTNMDFRRMQTKIFLRTVVMVLAAIVLFYAFYMIILRGNFATFIVGIFQNLFLMEYDDAVNLYRQVFRNNIMLLFFIAVAFIFFAAFRINLKWFANYFVEINEGIDILMKEDTQEVTLSPELTATEKKINTIKHTLERQKTDALLAEQRKNDLIVYLAHDLKTPLASVIGYLNLLLDEGEISPELREKYLSISLDKAERLEDLINELFETARFNLSNITLQYSKINLTRLFEQVLYEFKPMLKEKHLNCNLHMEKDTMLKCDADKIQRVLDNLLRNAVIYSFEDTDIDVVVTEESDSIIIEFSNYGDTIPEGKLERIFEQFYRADASRGTSKGGAGLGLAIAKQIVELHGGTICAKSAQERISFVVTLPVS